MRLASLVPIVLSVMTAVFLSVLPAQGQTTWIGNVGDWGTPSNWSSGEPTALVDAEVTTAATLTVSLAGEVCRNLTLAVTVGGADVRVESGSLDIVDRLLMSSSASGTMNQSGGLVTAEEAVIGNPNSGAYTMTNGTMTMGTTRLGFNDVGTTGSFLMSIGNPTCTITDSLIVAPSGSFHCGAGVLNVGTTATDGVWVDGVFTLNNSPAITMTAFTMSETATLNVGIGQLGVSTIMVTGTATLAGQILLTDILAPDGTYEILRGSPLMGTFSMSFLPPEWSWRVEGNSLFLTKGSVPVEPSTWGRVKARYGD